MTDIDEYLFDIVPTKIVTHVCKNYGITEFITLLLAQSFDTLSNYIRNGMALYWWGWISPTLTYFHNY